MLFLATQIPGEYEGGSIGVVSLADKKRKIVLPNVGMYPRYVSGYLTYVSKGTLFAVPFDLDSLEVRGSAKAILEGIRNQPLLGYAQSTSPETEYSCTARVGPRVFARWPGSTAPAMRNLCWPSLAHILCRAFHPMVSVSYSRCLARLVLPFWYMTGSSETESQYQEQRICTPQYGLRTDTT